VSYLTPTDKHWVCDIEADSLTPTRVWVLCAKNAITNEERVCETYDEIKKFFEDTKGAHYVGHNFLSYDVPALNRIVGTRIPLNSVVDTFILSSIYSPSLAGGHSLDAWGERYKIPKLKHEEWDRYSEAMLARCKRDVKINHKMYLGLSERMRKVGFSERGIDLEHKAWWIIQKQKKNGFWFNYEQAHQLLVTLRAKEKELQERIYERFPPEEKLLAVYKRATKADGTPSKQFERHSKQFKRVAVQSDGSYAVYGDVDFNLGSPPQRIEKLLSLGWVPREFTPPSKTHPKGQPKATDKGELTPSLKEFAEESGVEEVKLIAEWLAVNGRANAVSNWMDLYNEETHCIHGNLWLANTLRYRHSDPNTANIPRIRTTKDGVPLYGADGWWTYEARDLWQTRDKIRRKMVGVDATGIQFRILAHYLNSEEFTEVVLSGDIHTYNQNKTGLGTRDQNKTFGYAALLGAGAAKTGQIFGVSEREGKKIKEKWIATIPGLRQLYDRLEGELKRTGRITLCDGTKVLVSSPHMVLAYLLQGDESRIMKQAAIYVDQEVRNAGLDVLKVGDIHDEWQSDVLVSCVDEYIRICVEAFKSAGESFAYNLPIECDAKIGLTWAETH
jgi:DNA polymerase-1